MAHQTATISELRQQTTSVTAAAEAGHHQIITRLGSPAVAIVPMDWHTYAVAAIERVAQLDACFELDSTVKAPRPKTPEESP